VPNSVGQNACSQDISYVLQRDWAVIHITEQADVVDVTQLLVSA
jgi:hypothetical protein